MHRRHVCLRTVASLAALLVAATATGAVDGGGRQLRQDDEGWITGRTTYFGSPAELDVAFKDVRGGGAFGVLAYGSCGYTELGFTPDVAATNGNGGSLGGVIDPKFADQIQAARMPFPYDAVAAQADSNPDYPGTCGRCYEVRCRSEVVVSNGTEPVKLLPVEGQPGLFYDGDVFRPYLPATTTDVKDTQGRSWPGNPLEGEGKHLTQCWDESRVIRVRIVDACPCKQQLPGELRTQDWCCSGQRIASAGPDHLDLSYWAFEQLAHPLYGVMMMQYRPVTCEDGSRLPFLPGYISRDYLYQDKPEAGWEWHPYDVKYSRLMLEGAGRYGSNGTCLQLSPQGGVTWRCRECWREGYRPFQGVAAISFWVRTEVAPDGGGAATNGESQGVPPLKMFVMQDEPQKRYCFEEIKLQEAQQYVQERDGEWARFQVPMGAFKCEGAAPQEELHRLDFQNIGKEDSRFCMDDIRLVAG